MKKLFIILLITAVAGAALSVAGLAMGAKSQVYFDKSGIHAIKPKPQIITQKDTPAFKDIDVNFGSAKIEIIPADKYGFEIEDNTNAEITHKIENGKLSITQESRLNVLDFGFSSTGRNYVKIYVPQNAVMGNVIIKNSSGNLAVSSLKCENLAIQASSGNTELNGTTASLMTIHKSSGGVDITDCKVDKFEAILTSGGLKANNIHTGAMKLKLTSGSATISGDLLGPNDISMTSGNISLKINGKKSDFNRDISVISGNVHIDGVNTKDDHFTNVQAKNSLKIDSTSGNVTINFDS